MWLPEPQGKRIVMGSGGAGDKCATLQLIFKFAIIDTATSTVIHTT